MTASNGTTSSGTTLVIDGDFGQPRLVALPGAMAAVCSCPHPRRGSPNQDAAAVIPAGGAAVLLAVADGMGGTRHGGEAAAAIVRELEESLAGLPDDGLLRTAILNGIESANREIVNGFADAGSTLAAVEVSGQTIRPYHVGDSVILVIGQRGKLKLQTIPHSPVGLAVEAGLLDEYEAMHHHERHLVLNAVGSVEMRIELGAPLELARRDTLLLASDGLTDNLGVEEIIALVRKGPLDKAVGSLMEAARERMAGRDTRHPSKPDDLTVVAYRRTE